MGFEEFDFCLNKVEQAQQTLRKPPSFDQKGCIIVPNNLLIFQKNKFF